MRNGVVLCQSRIRSVVGCVVVVLWALLIAISSVADAQDLPQGLQRDEVKDESVAGATWDCCARVT